MNILFMYFLFLGPLVSLCSSSWLLCWGGMEISFMSVFPILLLNSSLSKESSMKYFCIQALASSMLFISGFLMLELMIKNLFVFMFFLFSLSIKLGFFPGHFWVPSILMNLDYFSCLMILGPLKIAPLAFLNIFQFFPDLVLFLGSISAVVGGIIGLNQTNFRAMIGSSSISHSGWMVSSTVVGGVWMYFCFYFIIIMITLTMLLSDFFISSMMVLSMSGLPPFLLFFSKLNIIINLNMMSYFNWMWILILGSVISLFFYLKFSYSMYLLSSSFKNKWVVMFLFLSSMIGTLFFLFFDGRE